MNYQKLNYEAPSVEVVEINVERGFEVSSIGGGFESPSFEEEDVEW